MNVYVYQAALYCEECGEEIKAQLNRGFEETAEAEVAIAVEKLEKELDISLDESPKTVARLVSLRTKALTPDTEDESSYDSGEYPKGPYGDGGGEADHPQHCDSCHEFLENPLTSDGVEYVKSATGTDADIADMWRTFYEIETSTDEVTE